MLRGLLVFFCGIALAAGSTIASKHGYTFDKYVMLYPGYFLMFVGGIAMLGSRIDD